MIKVQLSSFTAANLPRKSEIRVDSPEHSLHGLVGAGQNPPSPTSSTFMLDESMAQKYALPENYDRAKTPSKKRRGAAEEVFGGEVLGGSKSSGGDPTGGKGQQSTHQREGKGRSGNKSKGKGRGGKGENTEPDSVSQTLSTHAKLLLRLDQERRDRERTLQWAIDFKVPYELPQRLAHAVEVYRDSRPTEGQHPEGSLNDVQWKLFAGQVYTDLEKIEATSANKDRLQAVHRFLKHTIYTGSELGPDGNQTVCSMFKPAHRVAAESTTWTWLFRMRQDTARGRDAHEQLLVCARYVEDFHTHSKVRKDRAPKDGIVRQVEQQLAALRV